MTTDSQTKTEERSVLDAVPKHELKALQEAAMSVLLRRAPWKDKHVQNSLPNAVRARLMHTDRGAELYKDEILYLSPGADAKYLAFLDAFEFVFDHWKDIQTVATGILAAEEGNPLKKLCAFNFETGTA